MERRRRITNKNNNKNKLPPESVKENERNGSFLSPLVHHVRETFREREREREMEFLYMKTKEGIVRKTVSLGGSSTIGIVTSKQDKSWAIGFVGHFSWCTCSLLSSYLPLSFSLALLSCMDFSSQT